MSGIVKDLEAGTVAAYRYLAFLDRERNALIRELYPDHEHGGRIFIPCDSQVNVLGSPLDRAEIVLRAIGVDPHAHDHWVKFIGADLSQVPVVGTIGEKSRKRTG